MEHLGPLANREEVVRALEEALGRWEIDEQTARLVLGLPLDFESRRRLAEGLACCAGLLPDFLITALLGLRAGERPDPALLDRYLVQAAPSATVLIPRYWPEGGRPSDESLRHLLNQDDERVLVPGAFSSEGRTLTQAEP